MARIFNRSRFLILAFILIILVVSGWLILGRSTTKKLDGPEYLNLTYNYVMTVPSGYLVEDNSFADLQFLYRGTFTATSLGEVYKAGGITLQPFTLADQKSATFKKYVNETLIPEFKKNVSSKYQLKFSASRGHDVAQVSAKNNGQPQRFVYIKGGQHPIIVSAKEETEFVKSVEQSLTDVESSDLAGDLGPLKKETTKLINSIRIQNAATLFKESSASLQKETSEAQLSDGLKSATSFISGTVVINSVTHNSKANANDYTVVLYLGAADKNTAPTTGVLTLTKENGNFKLKALKLPSAKQ